MSKIDKCKDGENGKNEGRTEEREAELQNKGRR